MDICQKENTNSKLDENLSLMKFPNDSQRRIIKHLKGITESKQGIITNIRNKPIRNIAVCSTMSSGKSTLINALLGSDVLPAKNEATTAKITSIYDFDGLNVIKGYCRNNSSIVEKSYDVSTLTLSSWNNNHDVNHICLAGDFDSITNDKKIVAIHDTPGTNNSGDSSHHDVTFNFLSSIPINLVIFVANSEHLSTVDEKILLQEIKKKFLRKRTKFVFVLNKADSFDFERESFSKILSYYQNYLENIGFLEPVIFPISAKAARLFKMAIKGQANKFTSHEIKDFAIYLDLFTSTFKFGKCRQLANSSNPEFINIGKKEFSKQAIRNAYRRSGLVDLEKYLEKYFNQI
ncbi:MAG: hypothetical protein E7273_15155 [Pseudobutyrivibrio ruminis]|uniref:dynamin family protein n=1 Tax=Succinivibrio dextrinosolvens TaxID=83771 RepID=UPI00241E11E3|nr:dynamin family protein [Succinivibrio dextrinosolvens]MBE5918163.1 hypothetical protein [Pseudobutyrivibrio ruminis]MBE6422515.1 hypothetical protein [Succinivibrio dextrinosolvens]